MAGPSPGHYYVPRQKCPFEIEEITMTSSYPAASAVRRTARALLLGTIFSTGFAAAASAETLTVIDIATQDGAAYTLKVPSITVVDGNLSEPAIRTLFSSTPNGALGDLAHLTAKSITIPEISFQALIPGEATPTVFTYRDIELSDVTDGVATSASIGGAELTGTANLVATFNEMSTGRFDIGGMLGFYGLTANTGSTEMKPIYSDFTFAGGKMSSDQFSCDIGAAKTGTFSARPLKHSLAELSAISEQLQAAEKASTPPSPEIVGTLIGFYTDMLTAFSSEPVTFDGFSCSGKNETGAAVTVASGTITVGGFQPGIYPPISLNDFDVAVADDGEVKLGNLTWKQMDLNGPIKVLQAPGIVFDEAWFAANWRKLIPAIDGLSASDVTYDVPSPEAEGARNTGTFGNFDVTLGNYINGIPAAISLALDGSNIPLPPDLANGPAAPLLAARDITAIKSDTHVKLHWDDATKTIVIDDLLLDTADFGRVAITGTIGNATSDLFSDSDTTALTAAMGLTVQTVTMDLEDRGFYDLMLQMTAAESGQPLSTSRTALAGMAQGMTLAVLGNDTDSLAAVAEIGKFLAGQNSKLSLTITSKDAAGISLLDFSALETNPAALAGRVSIAATASGDPVPVAEVAPAATEPDATDTEQEKLDLKAAAPTK